MIFFTMFFLVFSSVFSMDEKSSNSNSNSTDSTDSFFNVPESELLGDKESGFSVGLEKKITSCLRSSIVTLSDSSSERHSPPQSPVWVPNSQGSKKSDPLLTQAENKNSDQSKQSALKKCFSYRSLASCFALICCCFRDK